MASSCHPVGPSQTGSHKFSTNGSKLKHLTHNSAKLTFFIITASNLTIETFEFVQGLTFEYIDSLKMVQNNCWPLTIRVEKFAVQKHLLLLLLLEYFGDCVVFTSSTTFFIKTNTGQTLSSKTRSMFSPNLIVFVIQIKTLIKILGLRPD